MRRTIAGLAVLLFLMLTINLYGYATGMRLSQQQEEPVKPPLPTELPDGPSLQVIATPAPEFTPADQAVSEAFQQVAEQNKESLLGLLIYEPVVDYIEYSQDGSTALLWIGLRDPETGEVIATEPGLSVARKANTALPDKTSSWTVTLQSDESWVDQLASLPDDLLTDEVRERYLEPATAMEVTSGTVLRGYKLPWTAGTAKRVTNSIGHYLTVAGGFASCPSTCRYAFDFADGTMFPLIASKGGTVKAVKTTCANFSESCTNYLILEDQSTVPTSYQVYFHMAYNSVPSRLRNIGAQVTQGEYIGDVDDTGVSTGHHLHFHVYTTPTQSNWSWGYSVDIAFDDVADNGGRPRTCTEAAEYPSLGSQCQYKNLYTSGNMPANPPRGTLTAPDDRLTVKSPTVRVAGTAYDDIQIVRVQLLVNYDGSWKQAGDASIAPDGSWTGEADLCKAGVPDGPVALTARIYDREGSMAPGIPVRQLIKNYACTSQVPPASLCTPNPLQVALYSQPDYRGTCQKYEVNTPYEANNLGLLGDNMAASVQVGSQVQAILYDRSSDVFAGITAGRSETLETNDANLADNRIGAGRVSGLWVIKRSPGEGDVAGPDEPFILPVGSTHDGSTRPTSVDSLVLAWEGGSAATVFDVTLTGPSTNWTRTTTAMSLSIGSLPAGTYTLRVNARNSYGSNDSSITFVVDPAALPSSTKRSVPFTDNMETIPSSWTGSGLWRQASVQVGGKTTPTVAWIFNNGTNYSDPVKKAGDLTSPPIELPSSQTSYLRFWYFVEVEDAYTHWDQRRVQIAVDSGPFVDLWQMKDDKQTAQVWLNSGPISLKDYAGKTVRLRFHFNGVDEDLNAGQGWMIDDVSINTTGPDISCADGDANPSAIPSINVGTSVNGYVCPEGDIDYYVLQGTAGQSILIDVDARTLSPASKLDSYLYLLDGDMTSVLAENDDEKYSELVDSLLPYTFTRTGTYYLKIKAWNHPGVGGPLHTYKMTVKQSASAVPPTVRILYPFDAKFVPMLPFTMKVEALDNDGQPSAKVDFYWHGPDWSNPSWVKLGTDSTPADGFTQSITPAGLGGVRGSALYVLATGKGGSTSGVIWWYLEPDPGIPSSQLKVLPATVYSTVFKVSWTSSDALNDITRFDLQYQLNGGAWQPYTDKTLTGGMDSTWFFAPPGSKVAFRIRAVDMAGYVEDFPAAAETTTYVSPTCAPDSGEIQGQTMESAISLARSQYSALYNLCASAQNGMNDVDWMSINAKAGEKLLLLGLPSGSGARLTLSLYDGSKRLLGTWTGGDYGLPTWATMKMPSTGVYYLEIKPSRPDLFGTDTRYQVWYGTGSVMYLPIINR